MLEVFWWGSVFLLALPVMVALLVLGPRVLPEFRDPDAGRLNLISATMSVAALLAMIYGLKQIVQDGLAPVPARWPSWPGWWSVWSGCAANGGSPIR